MRSSEQYFPVSLMTGVCKYDIRQHKNTKTLITIRSRVKINQSSSTLDLLLQIYTRAEIRTFQRGNLRYSTFESVVGYQTRLWRTRTRRCCKWMVVAVVAGGRLHLCGLFDAQATKRPIFHKLQSQATSRSNVFPRRRATSMISSSCIENTERR